VTGYLSEAEARLQATRMLPQIEAAAGSPRSTWVSGRSDEISRKVLESGLFGPGQVVRGVIAGPTADWHSWIVLGDDPHDPHALIVDPTIWSHHVGPDRAFIRVITNAGRLYIPNRVQGGGAADGGQ
jgi:hypothetical protein